MQVIFQYLFLDLHGKKVKSDIIYGSFPVSKCINLTRSPGCMGPGKKKKKLRVGAFFRVERVTLIQQFFFFALV